MAVRYSSVFSVFKRLIVLNIFAVLMALSAAFNKNYDLAILIFARANLILIFGLFLFHKIDAYRLAIGICDLKMGVKIGCLFYFCARFIDGSKADFARLKKSLIARNFQPKTSLFTYKTFANVVAMLFWLAFVRLKNVEKTLQIRGFSGQFLMLNTEPISVATSEIAILVATALAVLGVVL